YGTGDDVPALPAFLLLRQTPPLGLGQLDETLVLRERGGEWLVDDDVASGEQALLRDRMMRRVGGRDDDEVNGPGEQLVHARDEVDARVARVGRAPPVALHDGVEAETIHRADDRGMEYFAGEAETNESDVEEFFREEGDRRRHPIRIYARARFARQSPQ